jgi:hypothetical protein
VGLLDQLLNLLLLPAGNSDLADTDKEKQQEDAGIARGLGTSTGDL